MIKGPVRAGAVAYSLQLNRCCLPSQVDEQYRELRRQRNQAASTKTRLMKVIDDPRSLRALGRQPPLSFKRKARLRIPDLLDSRLLNVQTDKSTDLKRARREKDALESTLFRIFDRQSKWHFVQLQKETDQPSVWLRVRAERDHCQSR